jgi:hypothetical protein
MNLDSQAGNPALAALAALRRLARPRPQPQRCDLCDADLAEEHPHLVEVASRRLVCACDACALLFTHRAAAKYRRVPGRVRFLPDFRVSVAAWEGLRLPINLAFFLHSTAAGRVVALYPGPAGATESLVTLEAWRALEADNPVLREFEPDVEALLVNRVGSARECYRVGIDECYKLAGLIRTHWQGFSGGPAVWEEIGRFFAALTERSDDARPLTPVPSPRSAGERGGRGVAP